MALAPTAAAPRTGTSTGATNHPISSVNSRAVITLTSPEDARVKTNEVELVRVSSVPNQGPDTHIQPHSHIRVPKKPHTPPPPPFPRTRSSPELARDDSRLHPHFTAQQKVRPSGRSLTDLRSDPIHSSRRPHGQFLGAQTQDSIHFPSNTEILPSPSSSSHPQPAGSFAARQGSMPRQQRQDPGCSQRNYQPNADYSYISTSALLKPDSVCHYPDSSPVCAPHVLAAKDARLRANSNRQNAGPNCSTSNLSLASSVATVVTHHQVLETSHGVKDREELFDILNGDDDNHVYATKAHSNGSKRSLYTDNDSRAMLVKPKPEFSVSSPGRSSLSSSATSLTCGNNEIELTTKHHRGEGLSFDNNMNCAQSTTRSFYSEHTMKDEKSAWLRSKMRTRRKWQAICYVIGILALIAVATGVVLGFVLRRGKIDGLAQPRAPDAPNTKPLITHFTPDPALRKAFYGVAYNPAKSLMPWCGVTLQSVIDDLILMSQITNRIRLYGMDCGQADLTFQAIKALNVSMEVVLTIWVDKDMTTYRRQYETLLKVLDDHGTDMLTSVSVGNEVLFRKDQSLDTLGEFMKTIRADLKARYNKNIPVFTSEITANLSPALAAVSDVMQANLHPYFSGATAKDAANWTISQYASNFASYPVATGLKGVISEVGWPSAPESAVILGSIPGLANVQLLVDTFVCQANTAGIPYYWFELKDEPWKHDPTVPVEPYWGIFDKESKLKIRIPDCIAP